jgi:hypothetical protein
MSLGGVAINNTNGIIYASNGFMIEAVNDPSYPPLAVPPLPFAAPGIIGPVTGMAFDPTGAPGGILYLAGGSNLIGVSPVPGTPVIVPLWGVAGVPGGFTGLEFDPWTGTLWGVDAAGTLYFVPIGVGGFVPPFMPSPIPAPGLATGLAVDHSGPVPGTPIYVLFGAIAIEYTGLGTFPPGPPGTAVPFGSLMVVGLAFHDVPVPVFGASACGGGAGATIAANSAAWSGNAGFTLTVTGVPAGSSLALLADVPTSALLPGGTPFGLGGALYINPFFSPSAVTIPFPPAPGGPIVVPASLAAVPPSVRLYVQFVHSCAGAPFLALSDALQIFVGLP